MAAQKRKNRFDLLRLLFAVAVFVSHAMVLPGFGVSREAENWSFVFGELSIQGFFIISGGLVYGSYLRTESLGKYASKRVRRLYPAYSAVIITTVIAALIFVPEVRADLGAVGRYMAANLTFLNFLQQDLPGVFEDHRFTAINGALWTVKVEVMYYMAVPILVWLMNKTGRFHLLLLLAIYIAAEVWRIGLEAHGHETGAYFSHQISRQLPGQMSYFVSGIVLWKYREYVKRYWLPIGLVGLIGLGSSYMPGGESLRAASWAAVMGMIAFCPGPELDAARFGDFSYGIYGTHFPITQTVLALGVFHYSVWAGYIVSGVVTLCVAIARWHLIEKHFLDSSNWYRRREMIHKGMG